MVSYVSRAVSLAQQHLERRNIGVPFDKSGELPKASQRCLVQSPNRVGDDSAVVIDHRLRRHQVPPEVNLAHTADGDLLQCHQRILAVIALVNVEIVDV